MQQFEVEYANPQRPYGTDSCMMRVSAATPADAVEAVKRAHPDANIIAITALTPNPSTNFAQDSYYHNEAKSPEGLACDGMAYTPPDFQSTRSVAS